MDEWAYRQDGRDAAAEQGCRGCLGLAVLVLAMIIAACSI